MGYAIAEFRGIPDFLIRVEGQVDVLKLSGGKPLLHTQLLGFVDEAYRVLRGEPLLQRKMSVLSLLIQPVAFVWSGPASSAPGSEAAIQTLRGGLGSGCWVRKP